MPHALLLPLGSQQPQLGRSLPRPQHAPKNTLLCSTSESSRARTLGAARGRHGTARHGSAPPRRSSAPPPSLPKVSCPPLPARCREGGVMGSLLSNGKAIKRLIK